MIVTNEYHQSMSSAQMSAHQPGKEIIRHDIIHSSSLVSHSLLPMCCVCQCVLYLFDIFICSNIVELLVLVNVLAGSELVMVLPGLTCLVSG